MTLRKYFGPAGADLVFYLLQISFRTAETTPLIPLLHIGHRNWISWGSI
jgi:hypothetical protein